MNKSTDIFFMENLFCVKAEPIFFFFASDVPSLLYYSHIPTALISLLMGLFVFWKDRTALAGKALLFVSMSFFAWSLIDLILWAQNDSQIIMFFWSIIILIELLIFFGSLYMVYVFIDKKDISFFLKLVFLFLLLPVMILLPTTHNLTGFNVAECISSEGIIAVNYVYGLEIFIILWIIGISITRYFRADAVLRKQIILLSVGIILFLLSFSGANLISSLTGTDTGWENGNYGLFGMPVFIGFLAYLIVRYKAFDIKLIGAQALVAAQFLLIGSMLTVVTSTLNYILVSITLILTLGAGWILIKSVKKEIERKEELQKISDALAIANQRLKELDMAKSEFISIASHQLRTPLTAIKGYVSLLLEGSYGKVPAPIQDVLDKLYTINSRLVQLVEDLLNISRIEAGRIQYSFAPTQIEPLVAELVDMFALTAKNKGLALKIHLPKHGLPKLTIDPNKIKEVVSNLIDNALKYTKEGGVTVSVEGSERAARIIISDTGIGIRPEDKEKLFNKFIRTKETTKMVVSGTGLGLYVGKNFVEAHGGKIWAESEGHDKGSRFIVELPFVNPRVKEGISDRLSSLGQGK